MASNSLSNHNATPGPSKHCSDGQGHPRGRGTYVSQACGVCRQKKIKCDGKKPSCSGCLASKRAHECSWGKDATPLRKNRNEAFFEALKKRNDALKEYAAYLESLLDRCRREHGGLAENVYLQRRPVDDLESSEMSLDDVDPTDHGASTDPVDLEVDGTNGTSLQGLIAPIQKLNLVCGSLMTYGSTSVYRFRPVVFNKLPSRFPAVIENPKDTYVLLVEGVDKRCYNPNFDWARYLPQEVPLTRLQHDKALDLLFKFCTSWCLRIIPNLFLRDMCRVLSVPRGQTPPTSAHYSPMLHNAVLSIALSLLDDPELKDLKWRVSFVNEAKKYIDTECSEPNLCTVHALSTLGTFHSSQGDQTLGFMYFGMAARVSQALGLDVDCSEWIKLGLIEESDVLDRYWTFWTIFAQDVNWSLYVGRDFCVRGPTESDFKDMPVPFVDSEFDQMHFHHVPSGIPARPAYLSKNFASACELLVIARRIMTVVNGISKTRIRASVIDEMISDIDLQLNTWKDSLPPEVDITPKSRNTAMPHQLMVHIAYWWFFVLLHRPYFHRKPRVIHSSDKEIDHVKLCKRGAENIVELAKTWHELYGLRYSPLNIVQPIFAAGTIFLLSGIQAASGVRVAKKELKHSFDSLKLCIQQLREVGKSWACAASVESILRGLIEERLKPLADKRKAAVPKPLHGRSTSDGDGSIYLANPPSRRPFSVARKARAHHTAGSSTSVIQDVDAATHSPHDSPTISVYPALGRLPRQHGFGSKPLSANQEFLSPWNSQGGSTGSSQPIPVRGPSSPNSSSSSGSPVSVNLSLSPSVRPHNISKSPSSSATTPNVHDSSPSSSFNASNPSDEMTQSFSSNDPEPLFGLIPSGSIGGQEQNQFDFSNFEMSRYFAMLGGQPLSDMPFVGPIPISADSVGLFDQQRRAPLDLSDLDLSQFQGGPEHLTGDSSSHTGGGGIPTGYYTPFSAGPSSSGFSFPQRRAVSENFRTSNNTNGMEMFTDFDFTGEFH